MRILDRLKAKSGCAITFRASRRRRRRSGRKSPERGQRLASPPRRARFPPRPQDRAAEGPAADRSRRASPGRKSAGTGRFASRPACQRRSGGGDCPGGGRCPGRRKAQTQGLMVSIRGEKKSDNATQRHCEAGGRSSECCVSSGSPQRPKAGAGRPPHSSSPSPRGERTLGSAAYSLSPWGEGWGEGVSWFRQHGPGRQGRCETRDDEGTAKPLA